MLIIRTGILHIEKPLFLLFRFTLHASFGEAKPEDGVCTKGAVLVSLQKLFSWPRGKATRSVHSRGLGLVMGFRQIPGVSRVVQRLLILKFEGLATHNKIWMDLFKTSLTISRIWIGLLGCGHHLLFWWPGGMFFFEL